MARHRRGLKTPNKIAQLIRAAARSTADAERALEQGDCGEAVRSLAHAYEMRGEAEGRAKTLREQKGRTGGGISIVDDERLARLPRLRIRVANSCQLKRG